MPTIQRHGGGCCGVRHMQGFGHGLRWERTITDAEIKRLLAHGFGQNNGGRSRGKCIEAVITDSQFKAQPGLAQVMADNGFRLKTRFHNSSGGLCNVLHRVTGGRDIERAARRNKHIRPLLESVS